MNKRHHARLISAAESLLQPNERVEATAQAKIGWVPIKKNAAALAASLTVDAALGVGIVVVQKESYLVLTSQQLLFFGSNGIYGPGKLIAALPCESLTATVIKDGLFVKAELEIAGSNPIRLTAFAGLGRRPGWPDARGGVRG